MKKLWFLVHQMVWSGLEFITVIWIKNFLLLSLLVWISVLTWNPCSLCRLVGILPNRIIQPLAEHSEYPIEALGMLHPFDLKIWWEKGKLHVLITYLLYAAFSNDKKYLGSLSHDKMLKVTILSLSHCRCALALIWFGILFVCSYGTCKSSWMAHR